MRPVRAGLTMLAVVCLIGAGCAGDPVDTPPAETDAHTQADVLGELCTPVETITCGDSVTGTTIGMPRRIGTYGCNPFGDDYTDSPEAAWRFLADRQAVVTVLLGQDTTPDASLDLLVLGGDTNCNPSDCLWSEGEVAFPIAEGEERFIVVDSWRGHVGEFTMSVECCVPDCEGRVCGDDGCGSSCGECDEGTLCLPDHTCGIPQCAPIDAIGCGDTVTDVDVTRPGSTDQIDRYGCNDFDYSGPEVAWSFTSDVDRVVTVESPQKSDGEDLDILIADGGRNGGCAATDCVAHGQTGARFDAEAGSTYHIIVDGYQGNTGPVDVSIVCCTPSCEDQICGDDGCGGSCGACPNGSVCNARGSACIDPPYLGNDTCADAVVIEALPFTSVASTEGAAADYPLGGETPLSGCAETSPAGPDVVYAFTPTRATMARVQLLPAPDSPVTCAEGASPLICQPKILQITGGCPDVATDCVGSVDYLFEPDGEVEVNLDGGMTWYITVKGFDESEVGDFTLTVEDANVGRR